MAHENKSFLKELKDATLDYKSFFKTMGKDFLAFFTIFILLLIYLLFMLNMAPTQPDWAMGDNILKASTLEIQMMNNELQSYLITYFLLTTLLIILSIIIFTLVKEWVWKDLAKQKASMNSFFKFAGLNIVIYLLIAVFVILIAFVAGSLIQEMAKAYVSKVLIIFVAFLFLIPLSFLVFHFLNYSGYEFVKTRKFGRTFIDVFKSFSKIKKLFLPYVLIISIFIFFGVLFNMLFAKKNVVLSIIAYILLFTFLSWEKVYSSYFFKRIYG